MLKMWQEPFTADELNRLAEMERRIRPPRFWGGSELRPIAASQSNQATIFECQVIRGYTLSEFNEELPLYLLDVGEFVLRLFGQWLYDPHVLVADDTIFSEWAPEQMFFQHFQLRCAATTATVLELKVLNRKFIQCQKLTKHVQFKEMSDYLLINKTDECIAELPK